MNSSKGRYSKWFVKVCGADWSLSQFKIMWVSWGGKHPLSGSSYLFDSKRNSSNDCLHSRQNPAVKKRKKQGKINFAAHWVTLDQQKATHSKKEFGSEIKLQDACSHLSRQL